MSNRAHKWLNKDGLLVGFGTRRTESNSAPQVSTSNVEQELRMAIKGAFLNDVATAAEVENGMTIPAGAFIVEAALYVDTTFVGATGVLDLGTLNASTGVITDDDGIDAAIAVGSLTAGAVIESDGAQIGTQLAVPVKIIASWDTAQFTAGEATLVVKYMMPTA